MIQALDEQRALQTDIGLQIDMDLQIWSPPNVWGEKKHRVQTQNTESRCTQTLSAPNKKGGHCAIISNMKIRNMKGERISKYKNH
jgi:hypothetical protein